MVKPDVRLRRGTALVKLADLLSIEGWEMLCGEIGLEGDEKDRDAVRKKPDILLPKISHTQLLARVLDDRGPAISMLTEIMDFLSGHGKAARTTGTIATLPGLEEITRKHRSLMSEWDRSALRRLGRNKRLPDMWEAASGALDELLEEASEEHAGGWRPSRRGDFYEQRPSKVTYREDIVDLLREQIALIEESLPDLADDTFITGIRRKCSRLRLSVDEFTDGIHAGYPSGNDHAQEKDKIIIFVEQMRITASLLSDIEGAISLIELSVFRNLPQLFEVWLLCFILQTLERVGYSVTLENIVRVERAQVWNLKYAGARTPVAKIGKHFWLFFQFKTNALPTMPDLAIYDNDAASGEALIVLDAKFSEKHGYTAEHYRGTLSKYHNLSSQCFTVEYMDRPDILPEEGMIFGVRPGTPNLETLKLALFVAIGTHTRQVLAVIDCSQSFADRLPQALKQLLIWADAKLLRDDFILFARHAELRNGLSGQIRANAISLPDNNGTLAENLSRQLATLRRAATFLEVILVSDADFQDGGLETLRAATDRIWTFDIA
ncbi:hypothetical protein C8J31_1251 [Rhizobium sp. PP-CC-2G-626]|nr:hypothetical protein C8J31_1251 [Rhizobium sp. PP-CC-2G-626]